MLPDWSLDKVNNAWFEAKIVAKLATDTPIAQGSSPEQRRELFDRNK